MSDGHAQTGETDRDIANIEAWASIIEDVLFLSPVECRAEILARALAHEQSEQAEREKHGGWRFWDASEIDMNEPGLRHWNAIMRLKSLVVQAFVRDISNDHSPEGAAAILFAHHRHGTGSGDLQDYLQGLSAKGSVP